VLPSGPKKKTALDLPATIALESSHFLRFCTVPSASASFKRILEIVFCEGVQYRLRFCLDHLNCVKMAYTPSWRIA
jgi:hypothetical protein